jgi:5-methylcytosine-specific restriction endonuclease McrA
VTANTEELDRAGDVECQGSGVAEESEGGGVSDIAKQSKQYYEDYVNQMSQSRRIDRKRKKAPRWIKDAVAYWQERINEMDIGCDFDEADVRCWRCGYLRMCQKCHIAPKSLGGSDDVSNLIPLCADCHDEMPNVDDPSVVWQWIASDHGGLHETYWTIRAIKESGLTKEQLALFEPSKLTEIMQRCSHHFGQLHGRARLSTQTLAWAIKQACNV